VEKQDEGLSPKERVNLPGQVIPVTIHGEVEHMTLEQVLNEISSLTPSEQLKIAQIIWDKLPNDLGTDLSVAQQAELDRRWADYKKDPSTALTEEEFKERMQIARGK
jgi:putative addiction module component (TIGR02574 family)